MGENGQQKKRRPKAPLLIFSHHLDDVPTPTSTRRAIEPLGPSTEQPLLSRLVLLMVLVVMVMMMMMPTCHRRAHRHGRHRYNGHQHGRQNFAHI
jgi:hypothetical protein